MVPQETVLLVLFPSNLKINCFPRDRSLSVYYFIVWQKPASLTYNTANKLSAIILVPPIS